MKQFLLKTSVAFFFLILILTTILIFIRDRDVHYTLLGALPDKHARLLKTKAPRVLFVGGSNLSFGLDSRKIQDALKVPVVNMGIHAGFGLRFMMRDVQPYIQKGDVVVLVPEYDTFFDLYYGNMYLVSEIVDIFPQGVRYLSTRQVLALMPSITTYSSIKLKKIPDLLSPVTPQNAPPAGAYDRTSFNEYGDVIIHWSNTKQKHFMPMKKPDRRPRVNRTALNELTEFCKWVRQQDAKCLILAPVFQQTSFNNYGSLIEILTKELKINNLGDCFDPERYRFPDELFYDTPYHLNRKGIEIRTSLVIEDLQKCLNRI